MLLAFHLYLEGLGMLFLRKLKDLLKMPQTGPGSQPYSHGYLLWSVGPEATKSKATGSQVMPKQPSREPEPVTHSRD
jgi:hypothetical protein